MASKLDVVAADDDNSAITFCLHKEDHTLGNALRYMVVRNPAVEFCGYTLPHPSEDKIHLRIQATQGTAVEALEKGLDDLSAVCQHILALIDENMDTSEFVPVVIASSAEDEIVAEAPASSHAAASNEDVTNGDNASEDEDDLVSGSRRGGDDGDGDDDRMDDS